MFNFNYSLLDNHSSFTGYVDYALDIRKSNDGGKKRIVMTQEDLDNAVTNFLGFNGYPENSKKL